MTVIRYALIAVLATFCFGVQSAGLQAAEEVEIAGLYRCEGANYKGTISITPKGEAYHLRWRIGKSTYVGVGLREGNTLSSSWSSGRAGSGVVVYKIEPGPKLVGKFVAYRGPGKVLPETLTFLKELPELPAPQEWNVNDKLLVNWSRDHNWYPATVVKKEGERYFVHFDDGDKEWTDASRMTPEDIAVGDRVYGNWKRKGRYYPGTVSSREKDLIHIKYDDGDEENTSISFVRVVRPREQ